MPKGRRGQKKRDDEAKFEAKAPKQKSAFDDLTDTKFAKKQRRKPRFGGFGGFGGLGGIGGFAGLGGGGGKLAGILGDIKLSGNSDSSDEFSSDDSLTLFGRNMNSDDSDGSVTPRAATRRTSDGAQRGFGVAGTSGFLRKVNFEVDFRKSKAPAAGESVEMPAGLQTVGAGGDSSLVEQEDGSQALQVPEGSFLRASLRTSPYVVADDGRLHEWTMVAAIRLDRLPHSSMPIVNGGMVPSEGERVESVQVYKNGGVGALGHMGTQETALRADRWGWVVLTRTKGQLTTYVNGQVCAEVLLTPARPPKAATKAEGGADGEGDNDEGGGGGDNKEKKRATEEAKKREALLLERFCISPEQVCPPPRPLAPRLPARLVPGPQIRVLHYHPSPYFCGRLVFVRA